MADEIKITTGLSVINGNLKVVESTKVTTFDQAVARAGNPGTVTVGTTEETISFGDVSPGWVLIKNLDDTNFVEFDFSSAPSPYGINLPAGASMVMKMNTGATLYAKADTADVDCQIISVND